jgi:fumarate reductase subunit D
MSEVRSRAGSTAHRRTPKRGPVDSAEPFIWLGFSAGGVAAALAGPVLLLLFGLAFPLGWLDPPDYGHLQALATNPLTRLVLFGLFVFSLIHFAHRFRFTLVDGLQLRRYDRVVAAATYGAALLGSAAAAWILFVTL